MFWLAVVISVCALLILFIETTEKTHNFGIGGVEFTVAVMSWVQVMKCESDLRLLKLVDRLK